MCSDTQHVVSRRSLPAQLTLRDANDPGLALFAGNCAGCHTWDGFGRQTVYADLRNSVVRYFGNQAGTLTAQDIAPRRKDM